MSKKVEQRCNTCRFWLPHEYKGALILEPSVSMQFCHRYPQVVIKSKHDWCGEWKKK